MTAAGSLSAPARRSAPRATPGEPPSDEERIAAVVAAVPALAGKPYTATRLPGGLTNTNYRLASGSREMVVRLSSPQTDLLAIDRVAEHANATAAHAAGVSPGVIGFVPAAGALVVDWIEGETMTADDLDDSTRLAEVAATCRRLHAGPAFVGEFDMFALQSRYLELVLRSGYRMPVGYLDHMPVVNQLREAMAIRAQPSVPCHNDLLAANIMRDDRQMWFIDFEYSGSGDPYFELGNTASESHLCVARLAELVAAYDGFESVAHLARARLFGLMSDFGWTLWASIQAATSSLDFDFWSWGMEKFDRAQAAFADPDLPQLIADVQDADRRGDRL